MRAVRPFELARWTLAVAALGAIAGCTTAAPNERMTTHRLVTPVDAIAADEALTGRGPRVNISTDQDGGRHNRIIARVRLEEDAYVAVVNVAPNGFARVVFPETPADDGLLRGGRTYVVPSFFTGYAAAAVPPIGAMGSRFVWYGRSATARVGARGPGYVFVLASTTPLRLDSLESEGFFDEVDVGVSIAELDPRRVMPAFAAIALGSVSRDGVTLAHARYSGYDMMAGMSAMRMASRACSSAFDPLGFVSLYDWDFATTPGSGGCGRGSYYNWRYRDLLPTRPPTVPWMPPRDTTKKPDTTEAVTARAAANPRWAPGRRATAEVVLTRTERLAMRRRADADVARERDPAMRGTDRRARRSEPAAVRGERTPPGWSSRAPAPARPTEERQPPSARGSSSTGGGGGGGSGGESTRARGTDTP